MREREKERDRQRERETWSRDRQSFRRSGDARESRGFRHSGGGLKGNFSTSKASKVRSRWGGVDLKGGVEFSIISRKD